MQTCWWSCTWRLSTLHAVRMGPRMRRTHGCAHAGSLATQPCARCLLLLQPQLVATVWLAHASTAAALHPTHLPARPPACPPARTPARPPARSRTHPPADLEQALFGLSMLPSARPAVQEITLCPSLVESLQHAAAQEGSTAADVAAARDNGAAAPVHVQDGGACGVLQLAVAGVGAWQPLALLAVRGLAAQLNAAPAVVGPAAPGALVGVVGRFLACGSAELQVRAPVRMGAARASNGRGTWQPVCVFLQPICLGRMQRNAVRVSGLHSIAGGNA